MIDHSYEIQTYKGHFFNFQDLENNVIDIDDICHSLSNQNRWSGHTKFFYSVLQHSCICCIKAWNQHEDSKIAFEALMHDAPEYVFVDLPRPLKRLLNDYSNLLVIIESVVAKKLGLPETMSPEVKEIDDRMLITEY
ncbi:MAG: HD family hydrolase, partial [Candidatus Paceibacterota bacterium]